MNENKVTKDLVAYVIMRTDLPSLNAGKGMAQSHHAGVQLVMKNLQHDLVHAYVYQGVDQGADHFNTTIVLGGSLWDIQSCVQQASELPVNTLLYHEVWDPSYPFLVQSEEIALLIPEDDHVKRVKTMPDGQVLFTRRELTCASFLGDRQDHRFRNLFNNLYLYA